MRVYIRLFHNAELCLKVTRILQCCCGVEGELKQYIRRTEHTPWMSSISLGWLKEMKENAAIFTVVYLWTSECLKGEGENDPVLCLHSSHRATSHPNMTSDDVSVSGTAGVSLICLFFIETGGLLTQCTEKNVSVIMKTYSTLKL